jgi:hypothetical protein
MRKAKRKLYSRRMLWKVGDSIWLAYRGLDSKSLSIQFRSGVFKLRGKHVI